MSRPRAARGHMPFAGHRHCGSWINPPPLNVWVLAHWPHMVNTGGSLSRFNGWFRSRMTPSGWQAQFGSYRGYVAVEPDDWQFIEEAEAA